MFIIAGPKYDRYLTTRKKISSLALKFTKLERFKVKWHRFVENVHIAEKQLFLTLRTKMTLTGPIFDTES